MVLKSDKKYLLICVFVAALVTSNVLSAKVIAFGKFFIPGGIVCYAITYLMSDVIGELYGKELANRTVIYGLFSQVVCMLLISFTLVLPAADQKIGEAYSQALGLNLWFTLAGIFAYVVSQMLDVEIFHGIRRRLTAKGSHKKWIWNNVSTIISQMIDTGLYVLIAFGFGMEYLFSAESRELLLWMCLSQYIAKVVLAIVDTPFFYILTKEENN